MECPGANAARKWLQSDRTIIWGIQAYHGIPVLRCLKSKACTAALALKALNCNVLHCDVLQSLFFVALAELATRPSTRQKEPGHFCPVHKTPDIDLFFIWTLCFATFDPNLMSGSKSCEVGHELSASNRIAWCVLNVFSGNPQANQTER